MSVQVCQVCTVHVHSFGIDVKLYGEESLLTPVLNTILEEEIKFHSTVQLDCN